MSRDIIKQLKKLRIEPRAGYVGEEVRTRGREKLMEAIAIQQEQSTVWAPAATFEFIRFTLSDLLAKPVTALASFAVLVLGGLTTVSAAAQSLPGDTLYGVKIVSERAQLQLTGADKKAVLHTEFAERRLQELVELTNSDTPNQALVASTVDAFKSEVNSATQEIQNLQSSQSGELLAQVSMVNAKMSELSDSIALAPITNEPDLSNDIKETATTASETVVTTVVEDYESAPQPTSGAELQKLFQTRMNKVIQRRTQSIGRIEVIGANAKFYRVSSRREIGAIQSRMNRVSDELTDASTYVVSGGYRAAFESLGNAEELISSLESELSAIEFALIEAAAEPVTDIPTSIEPGLVSDTPVKAESSAGETP